MSMTLFAVTAIFVVLSIGCIEAAEYESQQKENKSQQFHVRRHVLKHK
jgi:hypothetical protein